MFKKVVSYFVLSIFSMNLSAGYVRAVIVGAGLVAGKVMAWQQESDTPILDELKEKYDLNNPNRNHQNGGVYKGIEGKLNPPGKNLSGEIQKSISQASPSKKYDVSAQSNKKSQTTMMTESNALGKSIGLSQGAPAINAGGGVKAEYARSGTREFYRDETGQLKMRVIEGVKRVSNTESSDLFSAEKDNPQYNFKANQMYGQDDNIKKEGLQTHNSLRTGSSGSARAYQALTSGAQQAINTNISEDEGWLQPGFDALTNVQDNTGEFFKNCETVSVTKEKNINYTATTEHTCMDTGQANFDHCEVERVIRVPILAEGAQLQSCGPGCYEYFMTVGSWKSSRCRITGDDGGDPAKLAMTINFDDGVKIKKVSLNGTASDHFSFKLNGSPIWESNNGSQGTTGNIWAGSCNAHSSTINTDVTSRFKSLMGAESGTKSAVLTGDLRWKRSGWMEVWFRIELEDTTGNGFVSEFKQFPEGCYDAISYEDKRLKGLSGIYNWKEIGVNYTTGGSNYSCERPASTPTCNAGETLFGTVTQEQCLSAPVHVAPTCQVGTYDEETKACYHDATLKTKSQPTDPDEFYCPSAGTLSGKQCKTAATFTPPCQSGRNLAMVTVKGVEGEYCSGSPTGLSSNSWSCSGGSFSSSSCSVTYEDFTDVDGTLIKTYTTDGFKISPVYDKEGELANFSDYANCSTGGTNTFQPKTEKTSFCTFDKYTNLKVGDGGFSPSVLAQIPAWYTGDTGNKTFRVNLDGYKCDPTKGQIMCHTNPDTGEEECTDWEKIQEQTPRCDVYLKDPECREVARTCPEGWKEPLTGRCMSEQVTFRCDREKTSIYETTEQNNICAASIPCAGGDECIDENPESNEKFVQAMVAGNILDHMQTDAVCTDPADPSTCRVFEGEYKYCSWETSGLGTDCCEQPKGMDILAYVSAAYQMAKLGQLAGTGAFGTTVQGSYNNLKEPIVNAGQAVADWASGAYKTATESFIGNSTGTVATEAGTVAVGPGSSVSAIGAAMGQIQQKMYRFVYDMLPPDLAGMLFEKGTEEAANELVLNNAITEGLSTVMAVYTTYQMVKLALTLLTACDDTEMDMGVRLAQRSCFKVGEDYCSKKYPVIGVCMQQRQDYCCYGSILSRIIMKESYDQLGINPVTGNAATSCLGLTPTQLSQVDFSKPSMESALQEWVGLLADSGLMKSTADEMSLTGGAQTADLSCQEIEKVDVDPVTGQPRKDASGNVIYVKTGEKECTKTVTGGQIYNSDARDPVGTRTKEMTKDADDRVKESKDRMRDAANSLDCSVVPKPPVCEYGFDPRTGSGN